MKRILSFVLVAVMILTLAACGGKGGAGKGSDTNEPIKPGNTNLSWEEVKAKIPSKLRGTKIVFYNWNEKDSVSQAKEVIEKFTNETGIEVEWIVAHYDDYATNLAAKIAAGNSPDIVRLNNMDPRIIPYLMPLTDTGYDFTDQAWNHDLMYHYQVSGKPYGAILDNSPFFMPKVTYYNRSLIKKYGLEDPYDIWKRGEWTWDKAMELSEAFLDKAGDQYYGFTGDLVYADSLGKFMAAYDPTQNKYVSGMSDTKFAEANQWVNKYIKQGVMSAHDTAIDDFNNGESLFFTDSLIGARGAHYYYVHLKKTKNLGTVPVPSVSGQSEYYLSFTENEAYGISNASKNAEAVPYFLRYYLDSKNYNMDKFYYDAQSKEVADWCQTQKNFLNVGFDNSIRQELYGESAWNIHHAIRAAEPAQVKSVIDSYVPVIENVATINNKKLSSMK